MQTTCGATYKLPHTVLHWDSLLRSFQSLAFEIDHHKLQNTLQCGRPAQAILPTVRTLELY